MDGVEIWLEWPNAISTTGEAMSDITKCGDVKCPSRNTCYRYTAKPSQRQSYADFNREENADKCEAYEPAPVKHPKTD